MPPSDDAVFYVEQELETRVYVTGVNADEG